MLKRCITLIVVAFVTVCLHTVIAHVYPDQDKLTTVSQTHSVAEIQSQSQVSSHEQNNDSGTTFFNDEYSANYCTTPRRGICHIDGTERDFTASYHLLVAFAAPPLLLLATLVFALIPAYLHWSGQVSSSKSRISSWKDGNTLYSQRLPLSA